MGKERAGFALLGERDRPWWRPTFVPSCSTKEKNTGRKEEELQWARKDERRGGKRTRRGQKGPRMNENGKIYPPPGSSPFLPAG